MRLLSKLSMQGLVITTASASELGCYLTNTQSLVIIFFRLKLFFCPDIACTSNAPCIHNRPQQAVSGQGETFSIIHDHAVPRRKGFGRWLNKTKKTADIFMKQRKIYTSSNRPSRSVQDNVRAKDKGTRSRLPESRRGLFSCYCPTYPRDSFLGDSLVSAKSAT